MNPTLSKKLPFLLFRVKAGLYAVSSENVREIVIMPKVVMVPTAPPEIRGVINLRGKVMHLIDLRVKLGMPTAAAELEELIQVLYDREKDHHNWLTELEACIHERRPFKLARDPHACKFGQWYDKFQSQTDHADNSALKMAIRKIDQPHQMIHATGNEMLQLAERGDEKTAMNLLATYRSNEFVELSRAFEESRLILRENQRELAVVLSRGEKHFAISIDRVEAVERIPEESIEPMPAAVAQSERHQLHIGKRSKTDQTILLMNEDFLFSSDTINSDLTRPAAKT